MTIGSPVGTVNTYTFPYTGSVTTWTVPRHDGPILLVLRGGQGGAITGSASGGYDDPLAAEVAGLRAVVEALLADPEIAKVADIKAIRTAAGDSKADDALVLAVAKVLGADPAEVRKKRDENPQWFADVVERHAFGDVRT